MIIGSTPFDILDKGSADRIVKRVRYVVKTGENIREESPIVWKNQTLWFSDSLSPVKDANGTIIAVVTISHNITERKHSEMALLEREQLYQRLLEQSFDAIDQFLR
jgi:PAS domain S-box-containing protein